MRKAQHIRSRIHYKKETKQASVRQLEGGLEMVPVIQGWRIAGLPSCGSETAGENVFKLELTKQSMDQYIGDLCTIYRKSAV